MLFKEDPRLNDTEIKNIKEGAKIWQKIKNILKEELKAGNTGENINNKSKELFDQFGVEPAFFNYQNFPGYICVSVNECIIHGVGNAIPFKSGDKVTLDIGFKYKELYIDSAFTEVIDSGSNPEYVSFVNKCHKALWLAIREVKKILTNGDALMNGDIASTIEGFIKSFGDKNCAIIDGFVGHTIGKKIHMKPHIFNKGLRRGQGDRVYANTVICIEPMLLQQTTGSIKKGNNGFDIIAVKEGAFTCHWEHMVLIKENDLEVLTASEEEIQLHLG